MCPAVCVLAVAGRGLLDSGDTVSNLCLHFASFSLLCLSPFPSECTAFHSVVLGDTYNIPLDPRGKQQGSAAPSYPSETPWVMFLGPEASGQTQDILGSGGQGRHGLFRGTPNSLISLQGHFLSLSLSRRHPGCTLQASPAPACPLPPYTPPPPPRPPACSEGPGRGGCGKLGRRGRGRGEPTLRPCCSQKG